MKTEKEQILDAAIKFELSMSQVYSKFAKLFKEDAEFWNKLAKEEKEHAQIIMKYIPFLEMDIETNDKFSSMNLKELKENIEFNDKLLKNINDEFKREKAFETALLIESKACEVHYRNLLNTEKETKVLRVFEVLNKEDKKHYQRIIDYINAVKIKI